MEADRRGLAKCKNPIKKNENNGFVKYSIRLNQNCSNILNIIAEFKIGPFLSQITNETHLFHENIPLSENMFVKSETCKNMIFFFFH